MTSQRKDQIRQLLKGLETGDPEAVSVVNKTCLALPSAHKSGGS